MRSLDKILAELRANQRKVDALESVVKQGALFIEAKEQLEHGEWNGWLFENHFSPRTASRMMAAYKFCKKRPQVIKLKLSRDALYLLAEDADFDPKVIKRVLAEAKTVYVNADRVHEIDDELDPWSPPITPDESDFAADPPPPPGETTESPKFVPEGEGDDVSELRLALLTIERLTTKRAALFVGVRPAEALTKAAEFLQHLARLGATKVHDIASVGGE